MKISFPPKSVSLLAALALDAAGLSTFHTRFTRPKHFSQFAQIFAKFSRSKQVAPKMAKGGFLDRGCLRNSQTSVGLDHGHLLVTASTRR